MEGAAIVADVPAFTGSSMSYNISLNLSSIFSFLPSRLLARLRKDVLGQPVDPPDIPPVDTFAQNLPLLQSAPTPSSNVMVYPGPWGFFTSGYMMGLFLMVRYIFLHDLYVLREGPRRSCYIVCRTSSYHLACQGHRLSIVEADVLLGLLHSKTYPFSAESTMLSYP